MTLLSAHNTTHNEFLLQLANAVIETEKPARDLVIHAGASVFPTLRRETALPVGHEHTRLPGVGVVDLALDVDLEDWGAEVREREGA